MGKRTWIMLTTALALGLLVSACGTNDLATELTPIPTLAPGETPALVDALAQTPATQEATAEAEGGGDGEDALVVAGEALFASTCAGCHGAQDGAGPALTGMADRAATRVAGMSAEEYIHESIVDPSAHVVEGFADIMPKQYGDQFSEDELNSLVAYIMHAGSASGGETEATAEATTEATEESGAAAAGDPAAGEALFAPTCAGCHGAQDGAGPALTGMGKRAATRVEGMSAEEYIHESIVDPSAYVVEGFADIMPKQYGTQFSEDEIANLIAYILEQ
ncbi:MAG: c-type cytochrome [Anaerolineae bacterium]|nr:c-type cytochrome [Anaerolineae bacterium]